MLQQLIKISIWKQNQKDFKVQFNVISSYFNIYNVNCSFVKQLMLRNT